MRARVIICPNPKCHRKIEEPTLVSNLSTTPAEHYYACPHCLIKLDMDAENARAEEVTLRLPKKLVDYLKAREEYLGAIVEERPQDSVSDRVTADMARARADVDALDVLIITQLVEEYGLKEIARAMHV